LLRNNHRYIDSLFVVPSPYNNWDNPGFGFYISIIIFPFPLH
jgi:hypothetical protein